MSDRPLLLTDIDDVCLSWIDGFKSYAINTLGLKFKSHKPSTWSLEQWLGIDDEECEKLVYKFNHEAWEFGCLHATADAEKHLKNFGRYDIEIIGVTCCSLDDKVTALRRANLYHVFGPIFSDVVFLPLRTSKSEALKQFSHRNVVGWVEDKASAALEGKELGYKSFLVRREHNMQFEKENPTALHYVNSWKAIADELSINV